MIDNDSGHFEVTAEPLSIEREAARVSAPGHGALATFAGTVRDHASGHARVRGILYESYPEMAEAKMAEIGGELIARHSGGNPMRISIVHRVAELAVGETSVIIAVGAEHRREALAACAEGIDRVKQVVPIWKKERFEDGSEWVGWGGDPPDTVPKEDPRRTV